jgi:hypothetical protein
MGIRGRWEFLWMQVCAIQVGGLFLNHWMMAEIPRFRTVWPVFTNLYFSVIFFQKRV